MCIRKDIKNISFFLKFLFALKRFSLSLRFPDSFYFRKTSIYMKRMEPGGAILLLKLTKLN